MVARICSEPGVTVNNDLGIAKKKLTINQTLFNFKQKEVNSTKKKLKELIPGLKSTFKSLFCNTSSSCHIFITTIGATSNQT